MLPPLPGSRLLDVGAGTGEYLARMAKLGWEVWGLEPTLSLARVAAARPAIPAGRIEAKAIECATYEDSIFDAVALSHSLEHLHDPRSALRKIRRWLRPGGLLRVWIPNFATWERQLFGRYWAALDVPRHLFHFTPETISLMLTDTGYAVERIVPQFEGSSLSSSVERVCRAFLRSETPYYARGAAYHAVLPLAWILTAFGSGSAIDIVARPR
jgi:SAM-dependent methyltransferase